MSSNSDETDAASELHHSPAAPTDVDGCGGVIYAASELILPPSQKRRSRYDGPKLYGEIWDARFKELLDYRSEHGDCDVPKRQGELGNWVGTQRTEYKSGKLEQGHIDRLNSIDFKWVLKEAAVPWETRLNELVRYKTEHGDCDVPRRQGKLGTWVNHQRQQYKKGKLPQDRIDQLESIGFDWTPPRGKKEVRPMAGCRRGETGLVHSHPKPA